MESPEDPETVPESNDPPIIEITDVIEKDQQRDESVSADVWPEYCNPSYIMPEKIEVKVSQGNEVYYFPVTILKATTQKIYLGGYRNKNNGLIYHHANSNTPTDTKKSTKDYSNLRTRDTQTTSVRTLSIQPYRESGTQMERIDLKIDNKRDVVKYPKPYFTSDLLLMKKKASTIEIQRAWRGYQARCLANQTRQRNIDFKRSQEESKEIESAMQKEQRIKDMARRTHPQSNEDFAVLFNELDHWRVAEMAKIKSTITDPEARTLAMNELLQNETKALQSLQQLKSNALREMHVEKTQTMLEQMARPQKWQLSRGEVATVHTPETLRSKELLDLWNALNAPLLRTDQRLDVLLNVKWTVNEFNTPLADDIKELVDREADLLNRGRPLKSMSLLRDRLRNSFQKFLENPLYNPRAADFMRDKAITMK